MRLEFWENQNFDLLVVLDEKLSVDYREVVVVVCSNVVVLACPWWKVAAWVILYYKKLMDVAEADFFLSWIFMYSYAVCNSEKCFFSGCEWIWWCINDESRFCTMFTLTADPCFMQPQPTRKTSDTGTVKKPSLYWRVKLFNPSQGQKV